MLNYAHMREFGGSREQQERRLNQKLVADIVKRARNFRATYTSEATCVGQAMRGLIHDNDPDRQAYFKAAIQELKRSPARPEAPVVKASTPPTAPRHDVPSFRRSAPLAEQLGAKAWADMLLDAANQDSLHPLDARGLDEDAA